ncbi:OLC1v1039141C1 [Oldenlandia corymbosa var. corymbosa]|uniref:Glycosyltransferase n=1 Tax=Oldenlandia corymbosa var. corymbosa TaxID=529605 RepID=A0AAV1D1K8_OLDCO|nr:OLC1v1039141C1 [Oldenlandia corymbosa var. corymbosa]
MTSLVLYPSPGMGHLISMVELGKFILNHHPEFEIVVLTVSLPVNTGATASYIKAVSASNTSITFISLPNVTLPHDLNSYTAMEAIIYDTLHLSNPHVHQALQSISSKNNNTTISAFIIDFFCYPSLSVSAQLNIPTYFFFTSGANCLATFLYFPTLHRSTTKSFKDMNEILHIPGLPPLPSSDMILPMLDRTTPEYACFLETATFLPKSSGIIINTFSSLEEEVLKSISQGTYVQDGPTPPLFPIGPLISTQGRGRKHDCLEWLDKQRSGSVVFLCFGSLGLFSAEQLREIAIGLEKSEKKFLWVVRSPPSKDKSKRYLPPPEPELDLLLPDGFLERTEDRGLIVKSWAPQLEILNHGSVGGFVTHCGWNSVLEAVCAGVPMVAWPLYAEQRINRIYLVEELKLALPMVEGENGFVNSIEVEKRVRELMDEEGGGGKLIRENIQAKKEEAELAMADGGSSVIELQKLVDSWKLSL